MASRKTYFGIGWKDPTDPDGGSQVRIDAEDRSAPTVVDEEKVAEGLRQLRSWYQGDEQQDKSPINPAPPAQPHPLNPLLGAQSRPTAVGHATGAPQAIQQRPMAPDPMRATMYGHDVHQFDLEMPPTGGTPPAGSAPLLGSAPSIGRAPAVVHAPPVLSPPPVVNPPPPVSTALVPAAEAARWRQEDSYRSADGPEARSPSGSFPIARHPQGEAERLQRPGGPRRSWHDEARPTARTPIGPRIMFAVGMAALAGAVLIWLQSDAEPDVPAVAPTAAAPPARIVPDPPVAPAPPQLVQPALPPAATVQPAPRASVTPSVPAPAPAPDRTLTPAAMRGPSPPVAATRPPPAVAPIGGRPVRSPTPAARPRRTHDPKVEVAKWTEDGDGSAEPPTPKTPDNGARKNASDTGTRRSGSDTSARKGADVGPDSDATLPPSED